MPDKSADTAPLQPSTTSLPGQQADLTVQIPRLVHVLALHGLLHVDSDRYFLSRKGRRAATLSEARCRIELAELLIRSGLMHDQVRQVIEASTIDREGMACSRVGQLQHSAPQLLGLLRAWTEIVGPSLARIPSDLFASIDAPWSLVPTPKEKEDIKGLLDIERRLTAFTYYDLRPSYTLPLVGFQGTTRDLATTLKTGP